MPPPRKAIDDGKLDIHACYTPVSTPLTFVSANVAVCAVGSSVCLWNVVENTREYIYTTSYSISKLCANPAKGLLAFCEGGNSPRAFVYSIEPRKLLFELTNLTELELADLSFSRCGSRLYAMSRATSKKLMVFSTKTAKELPGSEVSLPLRFDKISVFPGHKDNVALIRSSSVRIVSIQKCFDTYITRLLPSAMPADADLAISAYAWTNAKQFVFATRQGAVVTLDGTSGLILHACQSADPITSIAVTADHMVTSHLGNVLKVWTHSPIQEGANSQKDGLAMLQQMPSMEGDFDQGPNPFGLQRVFDLDSILQDSLPEERLLGQVAHMQMVPDTMNPVVTTAEGEVWMLELPTDTATVDQASAFPEEPPDVPMHLLSWFPTHPVTDAVFLGPTGRLGASCDESGRLRIWELGQKTDHEPKGFRTLCFTSPLTCLSVNAVGNFLVVGSESGCIHLVHVPVWHKATVVDTIRISESGIAKICNVFWEGGALFLAASTFDNKIAFLMVPMSDPKLRMYGFVDLACNIEDICFYKAAAGETGGTHKLLVVGTCTDSPANCLWLVGTPSPEHEATSQEIPRAVCPIWSTKIGAGQRLEEKATTVASAGQKTFVGFANGHIKCYSMPDTPGLPAAKQPVTQATETMPAHPQLITQLHVSSCGKYLVSASMDGMIRRAQIEGGKAVLQKSVHNPYNGGVLQACLSESSDLILSSGGSDGVLVWSDPKQHVATPGPLEDAEKEVDDVEVHANIDDKDITTYPLWVPKNAEEGAQAEDNDDPEMNALAQAQHRALVLEVEALRKKLRVLIDQNASCPELEKLDRNEFCVDFEQRDAIAATTKERCDALRADIEKENIVRQLLRDRLIKEFWDPMRGKGCEICSLSTNLAVSNYPERITSPEEQSTLRKLRLMRQVDHMEAQMLQGPDCPAGLEDDIVLKADPFASGKEGYIVNWWHHGSVAQSGEAAHSDQKYLYEPFALLTNCRRRLQIYILQSLAAEYRQAFNKLFQTCQVDKKNIMDQIKEKVLRTRAILGELQIDEKVPEPALNPTEDPDDVLNVKDNEIKVEKWISPEEKAAIEEARLKEEERLRQLRENDAGQRALNQMMGGTLKTKKDLSALEITLDKEPWMDEIPEDEMSEAQLAALADFRAKEAALAEEQDKYRKQLDAELKKLKTEVSELMQQFEVVLKELHHNRFSHDAKFFCQELYCVRLHLALLQSIEDSQVLKTSTKDVDEARTKLEAAAAILDKFSGEVGAKKAKQDERVKFEREIASAQYFKQQFAQSGLEPEAVGALLQLFRKKKPGAAHAPEEKKKKHGDAAANREEENRAPPTALTAADPYTDLGVDTGTQAADAQQEDVVLECPEGVDEASFQKMLELRRDRLAAEAEVAAGAAELAEMCGLQAHYQRENDAAAQMHDQLVSELQDHSDLMKREEYDIEIMFKLKQGQVEVPQAAVVTDYSDAVVIDNEVVESRNSRILELGKDKVGTLGTIKEFRKKLSLIQWEYKMLQMQTLDLEERTKDVHMLRVTKGLQTLLKGGEEGRNKADADLLERKVEHLTSTTAQKEATLKKHFVAGSHANKMRKQENSMLEKKLRELQQNVIQREHIRRLRAPQGGGPQGGAQEGDKPRIVGGGGRIVENEALIRAAQTGFRDIKTRQTMMDAAKRHTDEIDLLTKELDRLRQKTFPSFVQLHEERAPPDHR